jgi:nucleoside-triphosphatase THEP1
VIGLLTGAIGAGKTSAAGRVVDLARRQGIACGGILAPALLDASGAKVGISAVDLLSGERRTLAHMSQTLGGPRVGPYCFDATVLAWAADAIELAIGRCDLLVVDEIGRLELESGIGLASILPRVAAECSAQRWLVVVREELLPALRSRLGPAAPLIFELTPASRDALPAEILAWITWSRKSRG